jgi:hypothetical protein
MKILDFDKFTRIYEADENQGDPEEIIKEETKDIIRRIITSYGTCYASMISLSPDYKEIMQDLDGISNSKNIQSLTASLEKLAPKVSEKLAQPYKDAGVNQAWLEAAQKVIEAIKSLADQYAENKDVLNQIYLDARTWFMGYSMEIKKAKQEADKAKAVVSESLILEKSDLFTTKKENAKSLLQQATTLKAEIETSIKSGDKKLNPVLNRKKQEISDIVVRLAEISVARRKEIKEEELKEISDKLAKIPTELNAEVERLTKANKANQQAAVIFLQALNLIEKAIEKEQVVTAELQKKAAEEEAKKKEGEAAKAKETQQGERLKIEKRIDPAVVTAKEVNPEVQKFQQLVIDKFKDYKPFEDFDLFQKFKKFGADGRFGPTTKNMVISLKAGYDLDDESSKITQTLIDKLYDDPPLNESNESSRYFIVGFDHYQKYGPILEAFDPAAAKSKAPKSSGSSSKSSSGGSSSSNKSGSAGSADPAGSAGSTGFEVTETAERVKERVINNLNHLSSKIAKLYENDSHWEDYKKDLNDDEVLAVKETFGVKVVNSDKLISGGTTFEKVEGKWENCWWNKEIEPLLKYCWNLIQKNKQKLEDVPVKEGMNLFQLLEGNIKFFGGVYLQNNLPAKGGLCNWEDIDWYKVTGSNLTNIRENNKMSDIFTQLVTGTRKISGAYTNVVWDVIESFDPPAAKKYSADCNF